jgi:hypothetical protein
LEERVAQDRSLDYGTEQMKAIEYNLTNARISREVKARGSTPCVYGPRDDLAGERVRFFFTATALDSGGRLWPRGVVTSKGTWLLEMHSHASILMNA